MPLEYLLGLVGDMYCVSNTFRMLVFHVIILSFPDEGGYLPRVAPEYGLAT